MVLTLNCFNRHRHTHHLENFNDIQSCASVVLTLNCFNDIDIHITEGTLMVFRVVHLWF